LLLAERSRKKIGALSWTFLHSDIRALIFEGLLCEPELKERCLAKCGENVQDILLAKLTGPLSIGPWNAANQVQSVSD